MIVLQEIDYSDSDQLLSDDRSPYIRHQKTIAASGPVPSAAIISQPSHVHLAQTASSSSLHDSVDSSETDSCVSMSELAPRGSDFVNLQEHTISDDVELHSMALHVEVAHANGDASDQVCLLNFMCALAFACRACHSFRLSMFFRV
jgi:hypothetical protein